MQNGKYKPIERYLAPEWFTERVHFRDCGIQDVSLLTEIFNSCHYVEPWDPTFYIVDQNEIKLLVEKSLSETGENKGFRLQCLEVKDTTKIIGYFHLQHYSP